MAKGSSKGSSGGIFGFFGTTIQCDSTDTSIYCTIMKIFNMLIVIFIVFYFLHLANSYLNFHPMKWVKMKK
jgi:hypothetical protein